MKQRILNLPKIYFLLLAIIIGSFFVRAYRLHDLLGFYYDQGRDALVIWKLWHEGKLFLIGPVTGLAGIFLGPFYYYLIAPFYLLGKGDPVIPALFLAGLTTTAVLVLYVLGSSFHSKTAGIVASGLCDLKQDERLDLLYTLYEADPPHKHRLDAWLARQEGIGIVEETATFGGITVERRTRIDNE